MDLSHLNLSQLEAFVETCRLGSYTRAAERLYISQPGLHRKVKQLEADLGVPLLIVRDRRVMPTAAGMVLLGAAERMLNELHSLESYFAQLSGEHVVHAGATMSLAVMALPAVIAAFHADHPATEVRSVSLEPDEIHAALTSGRADFVVTYQGYVPPDVEVEPLVEREVVCAAAPDHPLVDGRVHRPDDLLTYPIALNEKGMGLRTLAETWFRQVLHLTDLPVAFEARTGVLLAQAVVSLPGFLTFLPRPSVVHFGLGEIRIDGPRMVYPIVICRLPAQRRRLIVEQFLDALRAWAEGQKLALVPAAPV